MPRLGYADCPCCYLHWKRRLVHLEPVMVGVGGDKWNALAQNVSLN